MDDTLEQAIMDKLGRSRWAAMRAILQNPSEPTDEEIRLIEAAMKNLAKQGKVTLWQLSYKHEPTRMLAVALPGLELDKDLEQRGAWAEAERLTVED